MHHMISIKAVSAVYHFNKSGLGMAIWLDRRFRIIIFIVLIYFLIISTLSTSFKISVVNYHNLEIIVTWTLIFCLELSKQYASFVCVCDYFYYFIFYFLLYWLSSNFQLFFVNVLNDISISMAMSKNQSLNLFVISVLLFLNYWFLLLSVGFFPNVSECF